MIPLPRPCNSNPALAVGLLLVLACATSSPAFAREVPTGVEAGKGETPQDPKSLRHDGPLNLPKAMQLAAQRNLVVLTQRLEKRRVALGYRIARGAFLPELKIDTSYLNQTASSPPRIQTLKYGAEVVWKAPIGTTVTAGMSIDQRLAGQSTVSVGGLVLPQSTSHRATLALTATQPLLKGGWEAGAGNTLNEARLDTAIQNALFAQQLEDLLVEVENAYWALAFAQADVANKKRARDRAKGQYEDTKENIRRGIIADIEIYVVEENLVFFKQELVQAEENLVLAQRKLAQLLLVDGRSKLVASEPLVNPLPQTPAKSATIRQGLLQSPALAAERLRLEKNNVRLAYEKNQALPALDLTGSLKLNGLDPAYDEHLAQVAKANRPEATIGLVLTLPLSFDGNRARVERADVELRKQLTQLKTQETKLRYGLGDVVTRIAFQIKRLKLAERRRALSKLKLTAEVQKYKNGLSTLDSIVRFQRELDQALIGVRRVQLSLCVSRAQLLGLQGQLHRRYGIRLGR